MGRLDHIPYFSEIWLSLAQTFLRQRITLASTKISAEPEQHKVREMTVKERTTAASDNNPSVGLDMPSRIACSTRSTFPVKSDEISNLAGSIGKGVRHKACKNLGESEGQGTCHENEKRASLGSFKVKENLSCSGALRYALHLRFICPPLKKYSPRGNSGENERERRFYLYNDLRVVFPQRHTDSDEGKVRVNDKYYSTSFMIDYFCKEYNIVLLRP